LLGSSKYKKSWGKFEFSSEKIDFFIFEYTNFRGHLKKVIQQRGYVRFGSNFFFTLSLIIFKILREQNFIRKIFAFFNSVFRPKSLKNINSTRAFDWCMNCHIWLRNILVHFCPYSNSFENVTFLRIFLSRLALLRPLLQGRSYLLNGSKSIS
jgi:hypothetical protein